MYTEKLPKHVPCRAGAVPHDHLSPGPSEQWNRSGSSLPIANQGRGDGVSIIAGKYNVFFVCMQSVPSEGRDLVMSELGWDTF